MNIIEKLKQFNVDVTADMEKAFSGDFLSEKEVEKKLNKAESDRDAWTAGRDSRRNVERF